MKKRLRHFMIVIAILCGVLLGLTAFEKLRGRQQAAAIHKILADAGVQLDYRKLVPPVPSPDQNAVEALLGLTNQVEKAVKVLRTGPPGITFAAPGKAIPAWRLEQWPGDKKPGGWKDLQPAEDDVRQIVQQTHAALQRPAFSTAFDYQKGLVDFQTPPIVLLKGISECQSAAVSDALRAGRIEEAAGLLEDQLHLVEKLKDEPLIITQLIRLNMALRAAHRTWDFLQAPVLNDAQLLRLQGFWNRMEFTADMSRAVDMECALTVDLYHQLRHSAAARQVQLDQWRKLAELGVSEFGPVPDRWMEHAGLPLWRMVWSEQDETRALQRWSDVVEIDRLARDKSWSAAAARCDEAGGLKKPGPPLVSDRNLLGPYDRARFIFSATSFAINGKLISKTYLHEAVRRLSVTAIALKRHHLAEGKYPAGLADLVPKYIDAVAKDPIDGRPLRYAVTPAGFKLYSVGEDGVDDGGDATSPAKHSTNKDILYCRDLIWPAPASTQEIEAFASTQSRK